jgi:hypothetical protein
MPTDFQLYQGGVGGATGNRIYQSANPAANSVKGYADHQRRRSYQVTRQMNFGSMVPQGGLAVQVKHGDWQWYQDYLAAGGVDVAAGDHINIILLPKNTRLEFAYAQILAASTVAGLTFDVVLRSGAGADTAIVGLTGLGAVTPNPLPTARLDANIPATAEAAYLSLKILTVPATGQKLAGLQAMFTAEVVDWGQFDFNGNA